jgi:hypothetical protein
MDVRVEGRLKRVLGGRSKGSTERFAFGASVPRGLLKRVYVRATSRAPRTARASRSAKNALLLDGPRKDREPEAALVPTDRAVSSPRTRASQRAGHDSGKRRRDWIASGTFQYKDREQDLTGFTGLEPNRPARRVDVQVIDNGTQAVLASGATDLAGHFSISVNDASTRDVRVRMVSLSSQTPGLLVDVRNNSTARGRLYRAVGRRPGPRSDRATSTSARSRRSRARAARRSTCSTSS